MKNIHKILIAVGTVVTLFFLTASLTHASLTPVSWIRDTVAGFIRPGILTDTLRIPSLVSCDTIDTDADGDFSCGTDSGSAIWGSITGTLSDQTDLQSALNAITPNATHTGQVTGATTLTLNKRAIGDQTDTAITADDKILFADADDDSNLKKDTVQGILDLAGNALTSNPLSQFASTTSSQLAGVISDETGSGALVFGTNPTLTGATLAGALSGTGNYLPITLFNSGTSASSATFWRGDGTWATPAGSGTVTATGGSLTSNAVVLGAGSTDTKVSTGITSDGASQLNLGVNTTTLGKIKLFGSTSGDVTIQPQAVAGTSSVFTLPAFSGTGATLAGTETFTNKTLNATIFTGQTIMPYGSFLNPSLAISGDTNTGIYSPSSDALAITTGGTERIRFDTTGIDGSAVASIAEVNTGTALKIVTPDALAGSNLGSKDFVLNVLQQDYVVTTGDRKACLTVPSSVNGMNIVAVGANVFTTSSSGTPTFQIARGRQSSPTTAHAFVDVLSTRITIDANEYDSKNATTPAVINTSNDDLLTGDLVCADIDVTGTGTKGFTLRFVAQLP